MLPLRDRNPSGIIPWMVYALIAANLVVFIHEIALPSGELAAFVERYGLVPRRVTLALHGKADLVAALIVPALASMFLHGGWLHVLGNMWFLFVFGDNVEARLGRLRFPFFYVGCGVVAAASQYVLDPRNPAPTIGASGAIAGVLGAYVVTWPGARIVTLIPLFLIFPVVELPAILVLGFWFLIQFFHGTAALGVQFTHGVAYWAHVGGFVAGAAAVLLVPVGGRRSR